MIAACVIQVPPPPLSDVLSEEPLMHLFTATGSVLVVCEVPF